MYNFIQKPEAYNPEMWKSHLNHNCYMYALNYTGNKPTIWSGELPSNLDDNYNPITSPEKAEFWLYKFITCFILKKVS